jgi:hypothetical protein
MKLSSTVSQNVRIFVTAAVIAVGAVGCGGSNDTGGAAGSGGTAGTGGGGSAAAGTSGGGTACTLAQVNKIIQFTTTPANVGCTVPGSCHDAAGSAAGLDLASVGWQNNLVGKAPTTTGGVLPYMSLCANMGFVYLKAGSNPASGLLIDKINPNATAPCGVHMPNLGADLSASDFACIQSYLTTITTK